MSPSSSRRVKSGAPHAAPRSVGNGIVGGGFRFPPFTLGSAILFEYRSRWGFDPVRYAVAWGSIP